MKKFAKEIDIINELNGKARVGQILGVIGEAFGVVGTVGLAIWLYMMFFFLFV